jgi:probable F420-dependent oxidoreductase
MKISLGLPTHRVDAFDEFCSAGAITEIARAAEAGGLDAVFVTEHPIPADGWLGSGGHHALDPFVALSFAAAATTTLRLHTNLLIVAYRNPFLSAKAVASLDALSGGRVILGVGAGYLEGEFAALGVDFAARNDLTDEAIVAMRRAWTGESVVAAGRGWSAAGNTALPTPVQVPGPPIWIGGNSKRAIRRAVDLGDGWMPMPSPVGSEARLKTPAITSLEELRARLDYAHEYAAHVGRATDLDVVFMPMGLDMFHKAAVDPGPVVDGIHAMAEVGVTYCSLTIPGGTRREYLANLDVLARHVVPHV